ncbi:endonuclease domain-containing protein [Cryptosporangium phraense]|uniref:DUF559 domain-containing protein n=1 Tax=Cryptosporangium phraense TaxID=2593070 RepID=A0A545B025_9ACTN|nr:hypothetical protein [Cryptosporangium phraense]TQS46922.1 hypothetical protein FL583_01205 [Cryptosporangium phraense]
MARPPSRPHELRRGPFVGSAAIARGLITADQLRGRRSWRRLFRDVYVDAGHPDTHLQKCLAARLILPAGAALTGVSAACLSGLPLGEKTDDVAVLVPAGCRFTRRGMSVKRTAWLPLGHIVDGNPPITAATRTAWEIASGNDLVEAVVGLDVLFAHQRPRKAAMAAWTENFPRSKAARAIALADPRAESPQETRTRVRLVLAGFPPPTTQHEVFADDRFVARVDLAWPNAKVALEYDGAHHVGDTRQMAHDRERLNKLQAEGWLVLHLTAADLKNEHRWAAFVRQLRGALAR